MYIKSQTGSKHCNQENFSKGWDLIELSPKKTNKPRKKIKINKVICLVCNTTLESKYRHDFKSCGCENETFIDGGLDYQRIGGKDMSKIKVIEK